MEAHDLTVNITPKMPKVARNWSSWASNVGAELYGEVARFAESMAKIGNRLKSTVSAYNDAIPGLDRFIVTKSRTLKQLGSGKGAEAELPEAIDIEPKLFSSRELRDSNSLLDNDDTEPGTP
jgi:DNA anti-recombination protein RmuC